MSGRWRPSSPLELLGGVAVVELVVRVLADLLLVLDATVLTTGVMAVVQVASVGGTVGWAVGWLLMGLATFQGLPQVFPDEATHVGNDIMKRVVLAAGAVAAALYLNGLLAALPVLEGGRVRPGLGWLAATLVVVAALVALGRDARVTPVTRYVYYRGTADDDATRMALDILLSRSLLIVMLLALVLAVVSRLFPLPELLVLAVAARRRVTATDGRGGGDIAERLMRGVRSIWVGPKGVVGVAYGLAAMVWSLMLTLDYLRGMENAADVVTDPLAVLFVLCTLGLGTLFVVVGMTRAVERLPAAIGQRVAGDAFVGPRIPGMLAPGAALFVLYELNRDGAADSTAHALSVSPGDVGAALLLAAVAALVLWKPILVPRLPISDYLAIPLSATVVLGSTSALLSVRMDPDMFGSLTPAVMVYTFSLAYLSPFVGYEAFNSDRWLDGDDDERESTAVRLWVEAQLAGKVAGVTLVAGLVGGAVAGIFLPQAFVGILISTVLIPALFGVGIRLVLLPLYLPEGLGG